MKSRSVMVPLWSRWVLPGIVAALAACTAAQPAENATVSAWLHCSECRSGERAAVRALGQAAVPVLASALTSGPPAAYRDNMERKFNGAYTMIQTATKASSTLVVTRPAYIALANDNYVATYRKRAAQALGDLGGAAALRALQTVLASGTVGGYRADVLDVVRVAQASADTARFRGVVTPAVVGFGDTVIVRPPAYELFNADEQAQLDGAFLPDVETLLFRQTDRLGFLAAGAPGQRVLTIRNVGTTTHSQYTTLVIRTLMDGNDRRMASCTTFACQITEAPRYVTVPAPFRTVLSLWRTSTGMDTMDLVKLQPSALLHIKAEARWSGSANIDLRWIDCVTLAPRGNTDGATGASPEQTTVDIPAGQCWVLLVLLQSSTPSIGVALHLIP